ncbi:MAG: hypothetical protein ACJ8FS_09530 [Sphingomicrobium sp.]
MRAKSQIERSFDYALSYFHLHANQRMTVFNFFLVIAGILTGGIAASLGREPAIPFLGVALSVVLILIAIVFWKLDARTSFLIKHAEGALKACETELLNPDARLISTEKEAFEKFKTDNGFWKSGWTYSVCFRIVFIAMTVIGAIGLALSTARWSQLTKSDAQRASRWECVWRAKLVQDMMISVERLNRCSSQSSGMSSTNT